MRTVAADAETGAAPSAPAIADAIATVAGRESDLIPRQTHTPRCAQALTRAVKYFSDLSKARWRTPDVRQATSLAVRHTLQSIRYTLHESKFR